MAEDSTPKSEKTEEATPKKRQEARSEGQVAQSQELTSALMLLVAAGAAVMSGAAMWESAGRVIADALGNVGARGSGDLHYVHASGLLRRAIQSMLPALAMWIAPVLAVGLMVGYGQIGFQFTAKAIAPKASKISPIKGLKKLFSMRAIVRFLTALAKLTAIAVCIVVVGKMQLIKLLRLGGSELGPNLEVAVEAILHVAVAAMVLILAIALFDFFFQRAQHDKDLRMSKEEVKQDHKNSEGDPKIKAKIRQVQREMAQRRMMDDVPGATVVVTNPTHVAVALAYPRDEGGNPLYDAPRVVAKGLDEIAQRIKSIASTAGVPLYEDVPLARTLHHRCEIGDRIPADLFEAVAAVLRFVYDLEGASAQRA